MGNKHKCNKQKSRDPEESLKAISCKFSLRIASQGKPVCLAVEQVRGRGVVGHTLSYTEFCDLCRLRSQNTKSPGREKGFEPSRLSFQELSFTHTTGRNHPKGSFWRKYSCKLVFF